MSFLSSMFGTKPTVPTVPALELGTEQQKAAANNLAILPQAKALSNATQDQVMALLKSVNPGWDAQSASIQSTIGDELAGKLPSDIAGNIQDNAAARALTGGFGGSGMHGNLVARDLGLNSLAMTQTGISSAETWMQMAEQLTSPAVSAFQSMFVSPQQQAAFDVNERNTQVEQQWLKAQVDAMPDPTMVGIVATFTAGAPYWLGGYRPGQGGPSTGLQTSGAGSGGGNGQSIGDFGNVTGANSSFSDGTPGAMATDGTGGSSASGFSTFQNNITGGGASGTSGSSNTGLVGSLIGLL